MATLATVKLEYVIPSYHKYKRTWGPEIIQRLNNSRKTSSLESRTSRVLNLSMSSLDHQWMVVDTLYS